MLVVHMSDLHCGPRLEKNLLQRAIDEINDINPDIVVVTGDLTEEGLLPEFQEAKRYLDQLECKRLVVGSGNHDSKMTGYLLFPKFFGEPSSVTELDDALIVMLNSSRPDRQDGEIGYNQGLWMRRQLDAFNGKFKVIALHHHLIPVPDTGMEQNIVCDAGDLLWTLTGNGVNLVLCGHRHRPWIWELGSLSIVYAGTVSTDRLRGFYQNTYNIINIEDSKVEAYLKIPDGERYDLNRESIKALGIP